MRFYKVVVKYVIQDDNGKQVKKTENYLVQAATNEEAGRICTNSEKFPLATDWEVVNVDKTNFISVIRQSDANNNQN